MYIIKFIFFTLFLTFNTNNIMADKNSDLTPLQKYVVFKNGTEKAFFNEYWDNKKAGIYVDVTNGKVLFSSQDKFSSGTGWPSFTKAIDHNAVVEKEDLSHGMNRTEVRSKESDIHLGHLFNDGPKDKGGMRYCINSAALKFIAKEDLEQAGYGEYLYLFANDEDQYEKAVLAGGCFWGIEKLFSQLTGVIDVINGYTGGYVENPTYKIVSSSTSNHAEAVEITFDPNKISYEEILRFFFKIHDPTTLNSQGNDIGTQYRSSIFYINEEQKKIAQQIINKANQAKVFPSEIVTKLEKMDKFYHAEAYHQDYLEKNPQGYNCHFIRNEWEF